MTIRMDHCMSTSLLWSRSILSSSFDVLYPSLSVSLSNVTMARCFGTTWMPQLPTVWNFLFSLKRELLVAQLFYLLFQLSFLYVFFTGKVCSPATEDKLPMVDLTAGMPRGWKPRHKIWKYNMHQYYLMR